MQSFKNGTKVCGWMGYAVGDLRTSSGHGDMWIGVPVRCYMECNSWEKMCRDKICLVTSCTTCLLYTGYEPGNYETV